MSHTVSPKQQLEGTIEKLRENTVERPRENFTRLPRTIIEGVFGKKEKKTEKNFTPLDEKTRRKMGDEFEKQDESQLTDARQKLEAAAKQFAFVKKEEREAQDYFKKKEEERLEQELVEEQKKKEEEEAKQAAMVAGDEPSTKQKRGILGKKKPEKTMENKVAFGKQ